jgi:AcrR family transcriptional regulator
MRTGRPRTFCLDDALDRAMDVFWRHGYEGASLAELTTAMGINSPSLYAAFGSKEGLFRAVLERYDDRRKALMESVIAAPDPREAARLFLEGVANFAADTSGRTPPGCLLLQSGLSCSDQDIPDALAQHRAEKERVLRERFERDRSDGNLPQSADPATLARYLMAMANGICVQASAGASVQELHDVAGVALSAWPMGEEANPRKRVSERLATEGASS